MSEINNFIHRQRSEWVILQNYLINRKELQSLTLGEFNKLIEDICRQLSNYHLELQSRGIKETVTDKQANNPCFVADLFINATLNNKTENDT